MHGPCKKITSKIITSTQSPGYRWFLGNCVEMEVKEIILTTSGILCRRLLNEVGFGEGEDNISWEPPIALVTACPHLHPSTGCHHAGDTFAAVCAGDGKKGQPSRSSATGLSQELTG